MENDRLLDKLKELSATDFHIDPLGRIVIDNPEILSQINGAFMGTSGANEVMFNGGCSNSGCH